MLGFVFVFLNFLFFGSKPFVRLLYVMFQPKRKSKAFGQVKLNLLFNFPFLHIYKNLKGKFIQLKTNNPDQWSS